MRVGYSKQKIDVIIELNIYEIRRPSPLLTLDCVGWEKP